MLDDGTLYYGFEFKNYSARAQSKPNYTCVLTINVLTRIILNNVNSTK